MIKKEMNKKKSKIMLLPQKDKPETKEILRKLSKKRRMTR